MVHALTEIGRTLRAGGILLDIRPYLPFGPLELVQADEAHVIGRLDEVKSVPSDAAADEAIAEVSRRRLFDLEDTTSFYYSSYWDSVGEVQEYLRDWADEARLPRRLAGQARKALRAAGSGARLRLQTYVVFNRLRRTFPEA